MLVLPLRVSLCQSCSLSITKPSDIGGANKIDGAICIIMALAGSIEDPPATPEIYTL